MLNGSGKMAVLFCKALRVDSRQYCLAATGSMCDNRWCRGADKSRVTPSGLAYHLSVQCCLH